MIDFNFRLKFLKTLSLLYYNFIFNIKMHELSIAQNIIEIIKDNVSDKELPEVRKVMIDLGEISGVVQESLEFCFNAVKEESNLNNAILEIKKIPFVLFCNACKSETHNNNGLRLCEKCGSADTKIISGTEMKITQIELDN